MRTLSVLVNVKSVAATSVEVAIFQKVEVLVTVPVVAPVCIAVQVISGGLIVPLPAKLICAIIKLPITKFIGFGIAQLVLAVLTGLTLNSI